jgi:phosphoribosyl-dephospho-CoA transferase
MDRMADPLFDIPKQIKTAAVADAAFKRVVANLQASKLVRWKRKRVTQEAVFAAVWFWLEEMDSSLVEEAMARHVARLEALLSADPAALPSLTVNAHGEVPPAQPPPPVRRKKRG